MTRPEVGLLHPGAMGASLGAALLGNADAVLWASEGRSAQTRARAGEVGLTEVSDLPALVSRARAVVSVCPPHAAEPFADTLLDVRVLGERIGQASMAKACFALQSKALPTLWPALAGLGLPDCWSRAAAETYRRMAIPSDTAAPSDPGDSVN